MVVVVSAQAFELTVSNPSVSKAKVSLASVALVFSFEQAGRGVNE